MRNLFYISFLVLGCFCFGQQTFKVTDVEFQFINPSYGIIVKKDNKYYMLNFYKNYYSIYKSEEKFTSHLVEITHDSYYEKIINSDEKIFKEQIDKNPDYSNLENIRFIEQNQINKEEFVHTFQFSSSHFARFQYLNNDLYLNKYEPFVLVEFGDIKFIYVSNGSVIYQSDNKLYLTKTYWEKSIPKIKNNKVKIKELTEVSNSGDANNENVHLIEKTDENLYLYKNILEQKVIKKHYDTIYIYNLIIGKNKKGYDLYNFRYQKLNDTEVQAFSIQENNIQFIEKNKLKNISYDGKKFNENDFKTNFTFMQPPYMPDGRIEIDLEIKKEENSFMLHVYDGYDHSHKEDIYGINDKLFENSPYKMYDSSEIEHMYFAFDETNIIWATTDYLAYGVIMYKMKNGKFGIDDLYKFIKPKLNSHIEFETYRNLDYIDFQKFGEIKIGKNGLHGFFVSSEKTNTIKYKKLNNFEGNFARFQLPNGQKGWLDKDGNEYLDE